MPREVVTLETREQALVLRVGVREGVGGAQRSRVKCLGSFPVAAANVRPGKEEYEQQTRATRQSREGEPTVMAADHTS